MRKCGSGMIGRSNSTGEESGGGYLQDIMIVVDLAIKCAVQDLN